MTKILNSKIGKFFIFCGIAAILSVFLLENAESSFQNDSEKLALGTIADSVLSLNSDREGYGLGTLSLISDPQKDIHTIMQESPSLNKDEYNYSAYKSQVGLQGIVYQGLTRLIKNYEIYHVFRLACCFFLAAVIMLIIMQLNKKYGIIFASAFGAATFISPWIVNFSRNLYWVEFTWFIPMLLGLYWLNCKEKRKFIYALFFLAIFVKCLCGYEYISTIMMSGVLFIFVEWICNNEGKRRELTKGIILISIVCLLGFICAYVVHAYMYGNGNILTGLEQMQVDLIQRRTYGNPEEFASVYTDSLNASVWDVLRLYFWSAGAPADGKLMLFVFAITILALLYQRIVLRSNNKFEISLFVISLLATLSWLVLAKAHSYIHTHMNFVMFYMGWIQACFYIITKVLLEINEIKALKLEND